MNQCNRCAAKRNLKKVLTDGDLVSYICNSCNRSLDKFMKQLVAKHGVKNYRKLFHVKHNQENSAWSEAWDGK
jgi:transposase-like protein